MPFQVRYSTRAYIEYEEILEYVYDRFGAITAAKVDIYFEEVINGIAINPFLYPFFDKKKGLRYCVVSRQTTMYYRFTGECIEIVSFRGNRLDPGTLDV